MKLRPRFPSSLRILILALVLFVGMLCVSQAQERPSKPEEIGISPGSLDTLIETLEHPEKRDALLKELKALKELEKLEPEEMAAPEERPSLVERAIRGYERITRGVPVFLYDFFDLLRRTPEGLEQGLKYLSARENRAALYRIAIVIGVGIATVLIIILLVRRATSRLSRKVLRGIEETARGRLYEAGLRMIIQIIPYGGLWAGGFLAFNLLGIRGLPYRFGMLVLLTLLIYEAVFHAFRIVLSPHNPKARVIPLVDETAAYGWIWARRFLNLWVLYYFVTHAMIILKAPAPVVVPVRGILIFFFAVSSTILLLQLRRMLRTEKRVVPHRVTWRKFLGFWARSWPLGVGAFIWLISIFVITQYSAGVAFLVFAFVKSLVTVGVLWVALHLIDLVFRRFFSLGKEMRMRFPELEAKTNQYIGTLRGIARGVIIAIGIGVILEFWGLRASWFVTSELGSSILTRLVAIAITIGVVLAITDVTKLLSKLLAEPRTDPSGQVIEPSRKMKTLVPLFHWVVMVAAVFVGGVVVLGQIGVNVTPILAGAGIIGLAVGFGAQSLVKDFINGIFILFEDSIAVGDVVVINGTAGLVEGVTLRTIKMRDLAGNVHVIPNGTVDMITNMTKEYSRYVFDVGVAYREDVDEVMVVLKEIGESMQNDPEYQADILEPLEILGVDKFDDSAVIIKARITTKPIKQWRVGREFNRRMKKVFDEREIEIPFPHRTVYWGEPKTGLAPPLSVQVSGEAVRKGEELA